MKRILFTILCLFLVSLVPSVSAASWSTTPADQSWPHDTTKTIDLFSNLISVVGGETLGIEDTTGHFTGSGTCTSTQCIITITPLSKWVGTQAVTFWVNDGTKKPALNTTSLAVTNANPTATGFTPSPITTNEDTPIEITLVAGDADSDSLVYSIVSQPTHGSLSDINQQTHKLTYTPSRDYFGSDQFTFKVNDGVADSNIFTVPIASVNAVNDLPVLQEIPSYKFQQDLAVSNIKFPKASDVDSTLLIYKLELINVLPTGSTFTVPEVSYDAVSDKIVTSPTWVWTPSKANVGELKLRMYVSDDGSVNTLTDTETGVDSYKDFTINIYPKTMCELGDIGNVLDVTIDSPSDGDSFGPGDIVNIEATVENGAADDKDIIVKAVLYDTESNKKIEEVESDDENIDTDEDFKFELKLQIPLDDEEYKGNYVIYVKAYEDGKEDEQCLSDMVEIDLGRENHEVIIQSMTITPSTTSPGDEVDVVVKTLNIGKKDEAGVTVKLRSDDLDIDLTSDARDLAKYSDSGNAYTFRFAGVKIPSDAKAKNYELEAFVLYEDGSTSTSYIDSPTFKLSSTQITVEGNYAKDVTVDIKEAQEMTKGVLRIPVMITNNKDSSLIVTVSLNDIDWAEEVKDKTVSITSGSTETVYFDLELNDDAEEGIETITVNVKSSDGSVLDSDAKTVEITEEMLAGGWTSSFSWGTVLFIIGDIVLVVVAIFFIKLIFSGKRRPKVKEVRL